MLPFGELSRVRGIKNKPPRPPAGGFGKGLFLDTKGYAASLVIWTLSSPGQ